MTLSTEKRHYKAAQVADMLTVLLGKKLQVSSGSPYLVEQEPHCFLFTEEPKYIALTGVSRAVKEGEKVSGDQYATMESEKGKLIRGGCQPGQRQSHGSHGKNAGGGLRDRGICESPEFCVVCAK